MLLILRIRATFTESTGFSDVERVKLNMLGMLSLSEVVLRFSQTSSANITRRIANQSSERFIEPHQGSLSRATHYPVVFWCKGSRCYCRTAFIAGDGTKMPAARDI